ncbi:50S ribosomal protein L19e [Candidatus Micrarchaeota archaeon]|nr:50S ribosomal protein L19e [Candidatus Micrarchaeota archaeon]MBU1165936.1 50S ribosomal protein L19e [Candidatus Micrarchaeota archaeon]MBU1886840.1 50S ribosomal protein L19e [Candidatus Micrarchaeota archaeon]
MAISTVRRLAADILNVGESRIKISPDGVKEAEGALTRVDVRGLIDKGIIKKGKISGRASTRKVRRRGPGSRKGSKSVSKDMWMQKVRSQRKFLKLLISSNGLDKSSKRQVYAKVKSGIFRNKRAMLFYLKDNKFVASEYEPPKVEFVKKSRKITTKKSASKSVVDANAGAKNTATEKHSKDAVAAKKPEAKNHSKNGDNK